QTKTKSTSLYPTTAPKYEDLSYYLCFLLLILCSAFLYSSTSSSRKHALLLLIISLMVAAVEHNGYYKRFPVKKEPGGDRPTTRCVKGAKYAACTIPIPPPGKGFPNGRRPICPCHH
ncbi:hypothetical protein Gogos_016975, partial [Gossypium gossypioides]|nr:hypothetical protein [Gossypium gossypioides]